MLMREHLRDAALSFDVPLAEQRSEQRGSLIHAPVVASLSKTAQLCCYLKEESDGCCHLHLH